MLVRSFSLAALIALLVACAAVTTLRSTSPAPCRVNWSTPQQLMMADAYLVVESPQIVRTRTGIALLGDNAFALAPTDSGFVPRGPHGDRMLAGFLLRSNGEIVPIPRPAGIRAFIGVKAASDGEVAHVFWAGSDDTSSLRFQHVNSLRYARFDGTTWSEPETLLEDTNLVWAQQVSGVTVSQGRSHLMAIGRDTAFTLDLLHVVRDASGRGLLTRRGFRALYAHVTPGPDGTLWLATIEGGPGDRARVLVRRSNDGGRVWSDPAVVYRSGPGTAYDPRLVVTPTGALFLAWIVEPPGPVTGRADRVSFAQSIDNGSTWQSMPSVTAPPKVRDLWMLPDGPAALQVVFHTAEAEGLVAAIRWDSGQWSERSVFGPTWFAAMLAAPKPDTLYMIWQEWRFLGPERVPTAMMSRRRSCLE